MLFLVGNHLYQSHFKTKIRLLERRDIEYYIRAYLVPLMRFGPIQHGKHYRTKIDRTTRDWCTYHTPLNLGFERGCPRLDHFRHPTYLTPKGSLSGSHSRDLRFLNLRFITTTQLKPNHTIIYKTIKLLCHSFCPQTTVS